MNQDGILGVGDSVFYTEDAFIYEQTVNEYTADIFEEGFQDWAEDLGWNTTVSIIAVKSGLDNAPSRGAIAFTFVSAAHNLIFKTFGDLDWSVLARIATDEYAEYFGTYNPYEDN